ncbi:MAG: hypothetical protein AB3N64_08755 [Puniceicoccaceae bacterium]
MKTISRKSLYKRIWSTPITKLSKEYGLSDVGLAKICRKHDIPRPPRGYWAKLAAGHKLKREPLPKGENVDISIDIGLNKDRRKRAEEAVQVKREGLAQIAPSVEKAKEKTHPLAARFLKMLPNAKVDKNGLSEMSRVDLPRILVSLECGERLAEFLSQVFYAVQDLGIKLGRDLDTGELLMKRDGFDVGLFIEELIERQEREPTEEEKRTPSWEWDLRIWVPTGKMRVHLESSHRFWGRKSWKEGKRKTLIEFVPEVVQRIDEVLTDMEERRLAEIRREKEREEAEKRYREQQRIREHMGMIKEALIARERTLVRAARLWEESERIMRFAQEVEDRWSPDITEERYQWLFWARNVACKMDPLLCCYPDPEIDGGFDPDAIEMGGPYPECEPRLGVTHDVNEILEAIGAIRTSRW